MFKKHNHNDINNVPIKKCKILLKTTITLIFLRIFSVKLKYNRISAWGPMCCKVTGIEPCQSINSIA